MSSFPFLAIAKKFNVDYKTICELAELYRCDLLDDDPEMVGYLGQRVARAWMEEEQRRISANPLRAIA